MRILQINSVVNKGSTGRIAENLGLSILNEGWESYIAYGLESNASQSKTYRIGGAVSKCLHALGTRLTDKHGFYSKSETKELIQYIRTIKPDLIHLHNIHGYYLNIQVLFDYLAQVDIPVVWTLHDCWPFTGHCAHYSAVECNRWKKCCFACPQKRSYPCSWFYDNSKNNYLLKQRLFTSVQEMTIVSVSNWLRVQVQESFLRVYPSRVIFNGVDIQLFKPINSPYLATSKFVLLGLATSWNKRKGLEDYIRLSKYLAADELIVLIGLSKKQIKELPSQIIGIERTENQHELVQLYSQAGIVLSLSVEETFGLTVAEGFACGTPAIVYNSTATPELITEETGKVVEPHDIKGLRKAIDEIRTNTIDYKKTCRSRAEQLYNKEDRYQDYIELYKEILNKS